MDLIEEVYRSGMIMTLRVSPRNLDYVLGGLRIDLSDVRTATASAIKRLDEGFFQVRFDRLTPKEREYVIAMSELGQGPYRSSEIAERLGEHPSKLGPRRAQIIAKGMVYSPQYGDIDFTVPMFDDYLRRNLNPPVASP